MTSTDIEPTPGSALEKLLKGEDSGLGDLELGGSTPRIKILHAKGLFTETTTGLEVPSFDAVVCGMLRQRVLFPAEMGEEAASPLCKSLDGLIARPNVETFPLTESGLELELGEGCEVSCGDCSLKDWDTHPSKKGPWCTEQYVLIVMADLDGSGDYLPALLAAQKSALKPVRQYLGQFKRAEIPAFSNYTQFSLDQQRFGGNDYCVPVLRKGEPTPREEWEVYAENYVAIKDFLRTWPKGDDDGDNGPASAVVPPEDDELPEF